MGGTRAASDKAYPPKRVAILAACPFPANHGTPGAIRELAEALHRLGHEVHVVTYPQGDATLTSGLRVHRASALWFRPQEVRIGPSLSRLLYDLMMIPRLLRVVWKHRIDVIHAHNYEAGIVGSVVSWITGTPLVYNGVNSMADELPSYDFFSSKQFALWLGQWLDRIVPRRADAVITLSDELRDHLINCGLSPQRCLVMPLGVDTTIFAHGNGGLVRARFGIDTQTPIVGYTGSIENFQRLDLLVEAFARLAAWNPKAILMIVNNIKNVVQRSALETQALKLDIGSRVLFAEEVPLGELRHYLAAIDVAVISRPSCPGIPVKLLNSMAASRAIVCASGSAKCVCHGYNAYVARNDDADDLADGIELLLSNESLRAELGRRARASLDGIYDWDTIGLATGLVYDQVCRPNRQLDRSELSFYVKPTYTPILADESSMSSTGFLQSGPIVYPESWSEIP